MSKALAGRQRTRRASPLPRRDVEVQTERQPSVWQPTQRGLSSRSALPRLWAGPWMPPADNRHAW
eukprot:5431499-Lingulodinium_polyedra.AAC.1